MVNNMDLFSYLLGKKSAGAGGGGGSDLDWSAIGFQEPPLSMTAGYNYAKQIYDNWDNTTTTMYYMYAGDKNIKYFPGVDTSNVESFSDAFNGAEQLESVASIDTSKGTLFARMFGSCTNLVDVPVMDFKGASTSGSLKNIFTSCPRLSNQSMDNILKSCITATNYSGTKTLYQLGFRDMYNPAATIQTLPHYEAFTTAGWTIGY